MKKTDTLLQDHWILDVEHSNKNNNNNLADYIFSTLETKVDERAKDLDEAETTAHEFKAVDYYSHIPNLEEFNRSFSNSYVSKAQNWIGHVVSVNELNFTAKLIDAFISDTYEMAEFDFNEVSPEDVELLEKGAVFYWSVAYAYENGQVSKKSFLRFKRSIGLTIDEINAVADRASFLNENLNWD